MKGKSLIYLLVLAEIMFAIQSLGQTTYQTVPDSLTCITPAQDVFFLGQAFTIKGLQTSLVLKNKEHDNLLAVIVEKDAALLEAHIQEKYQKDNYNNSQADLQIEKDKLTSIKTKNSIQKALLWILGPLAIIETAIISTSYLTKKAP